MRERFRRLLVALFSVPPRPVWGWHVSGRDWPAAPSEVSPDEALTDLAGITTGHASAASASLLRAGERRG